MAPATKFYLVSAEALPEIFIKVAEAKRMLQSGEVRTAGDAARTVGISRSAFYKYRDAVRPFNDMKTGRIITFYTMLKNNPGVFVQRPFYFCRFGREYSDHQPEYSH